MQNLISIIIPVKNGSNYMEEAITEIKQQNMNTEIIVVDDGSTDNTSDIAKNYGCIVIKNTTSQGPVVAKNQALKIANGNYIMFHDHDDIMNNGVLEKMLAELNAASDISAVMCKVKDFISDDIPSEEKQKIKIKSEPYYGLFTGAVLIRKNVFDIIGNFDEQVTAGEILDWQTKMEKHNLKIKKLDLISTQRRLHTTNFGRTQQQTEFKDYAKSLRERLNMIKKQNKES